MREGDSTSSSNKNWLVKSSARILGPFSMGDLAENLKEKNISIIDEIRHPLGRWTYIRENAHLLDIIRKLRDEEDPLSEKTMTQSLAQHTVTKTDTASHSSDDLTPLATGLEETPPPAVHSASGKFKDIVASEVVLPKSVSSSSGVKSYGVAQDPRVKAQVKKKSLLWQVILIVATIGIAGYVAWDYSHKTQSLNVSYEELKTSAIRYKSMGLYQKSLQSYQQASQIKQPDAELSIEMAPVLISEDKQTIQGRRILEKVLANESAKRSELLDANLGTAVSYMIEGDFLQAEQSLQKALGYDPKNFAALLNVAIIKLKTGKLSEASRSFEDLYKRNERSSFALLGKSIAEIELADQSQSYEKLDELEGQIKSHVQKNWFLRQELTLLRSYILKLTGDVDALNQAVVQFLGFLPGESNKLSRPLSIDWRFSSWDSLEKYCQNLYSGGSPNAGLKALRAICLMEINRDSEASKLLQESKAEAPHDPYISQTEAAYLMKVARYPEALAILKKPELMALPGKNALLIQYCIQQKDIKCVSTSATQLLQVEPKSLDGFYGLAWLSWQKRDRARAFDYVRGGLELEPNSIELLKLRDVLEAH